jgi:hypothetical protein
MGGAGWVCRRPTDAHARLARGRGSYVDCRQRAKACIHTNCQCHANAHYNAQPYPNPNAVAYPYTYPNLDPYPHPYPSAEYPTGSRLAPPDQW